MWCMCLSDSKCEMCLPDSKCVVSDLCVCVCVCVYARARGVEHSQTLPFFSVVYKLSYRLHVGMLTYGDWMRSV